MASTRAARKQATRERVLAAARDLFDEAGYEASTIRMIAGRAGVAVGSVFTTFASKAEILSEVMLHRLDGLYAELDAVLPHLRGSCADRLRSIMAIHYSVEMKRPRLFAAFVASSFSDFDTETIVPFGQNQRLRAMLRDVLAQGQADGAVRADADLELFVETLIAAYGFNYRRAVHDGADAAALTALMDRQIGLMFDGVRA
jgi:TetR/AcrR family transcriptional regulator, cholesterol catabolism regulator